MNDLEDSSTLVEMNGDSEINSQPADEPDGGPLQVDSAEYQEIY